MENIDECLAYNIKKFRKSLGWTQEELAIKSGKSWQAIQLVESMKTWPELGTIQAIAKALGIPETKLFADPGFMDQVTPSEALSALCRFHNLTEPKQKIVKEKKSKA